MAEFFSPVSLLKVRLRARPFKPLVVMEMQPDIFKDFQSRAVALRYSAISFSEIAAIQLKKESTVEYMTSFSNQECSEVDVKAIAQTRKKLDLPREKTFPKPPLLKKKMPNCQRRRWKI